MLTFSSTSDIQNTSYNAVVVHLLIITSIDNLNINLLSKYLHQISENHFLLTLQEKIITYL